MILNVRRIQTVICMVACLLTLWTLNSQARPGDIVNVSGPEKLAMGTSMYADGHVVLWIEYNSLYDSPGTVQNYKIERTGTQLVQIRGVGFELPIFSLIETLPGQSITHTQLNERRFRDHFDIFPLISDGTMRARNFAGFVMEVLDVNSIEGSVSIGTQTKNLRTLPPFYFSQMNPGKISGEVLQEFRPLDEYRKLGEFDLNWVEPYLRHLAYSEDEAQFLSRYLKDHPLEPSFLLLGEMSPGSPHLAQLMKSPGSIWIPPSLSRSPWPFHVIYALLDHWRKPERGLSREHQLAILKSLLYSRGTHEPMATQNAETLLTSRQPLTEILVGDPSLKFWDRLITEIQNAQAFGAFAALVAQPVQATLEDMGYGPDQARSLAMILIFQNDGGVSVATMLDQNPISIPLPRGVVPSVPHWRNIRCERLHSQQ